MSCDYCYAADLADGHQNRDQFNQTLESIVVQRAAELVIAHCREKKMPLRVAFHGGGEPTLHWALFQKLVQTTQNAAIENEVDWWGYLATHGVLSPEQIEWLVKNMNLIGISCDGPPDIQNVQRRLKNGLLSSSYIEKTAALFKEANQPFIVRSTITPGTVNRQVDIVVYLHETLGATELQFEPVYRIDGRGAAYFKPADADHFVDCFMAASEEAQKRQCHLSFAGSRAQDLHGSYCNILRNVLHLTPGGKATACFFDTGNSEFSRFMAIGAYDSDKDAFILNDEKIKAFKNQLARLSKRCVKCEYMLHCARECPEICLLRHGASMESRGSGFRCLVNRKLAEYQKNIV